jgi:hypothetical protein
MVDVIVRRKQKIGTQRLFESYLSPFYHERSCLPGDVMSYHEAEENLRLKTKARHSWSEYKEVFCDTIGLGVVVFSAVADFSVA